MVVGSVKGGEGRERGLKEEKEEEREGEGEGGHGREGRWEFEK